MKKLFILMVVTFLLCTGCAQNKAADVSSEGQVTTGESQNDGKQGGGQIQQLAENQTMILGKINAINGNEIDLEIGTMNMPVGTSGFGQPGGDFTSRPEGGQIPEGGQMPEGGQIPDDSQTVSGRTGGGRTGGKARGNAEGGAAMQGGFGGSIELEYTGETKTIQIPVGLEVQSGMGQNVKTIDFTQLAKDNILRVIIEKAEDGTETIVSIQLLS